ncbi:MAG: LysR family transcriptional regulator [Coprococcus sp.]|nr:LysR family transcriptional regulator [Coprococcus sp.]
MFTNMRYVYEVYKAGSFSRAASRLYISQPALSAMVKKVEKKVGMPLFERSSSPVHLTECGKQYIKTAEKIMDLEEEFACYVGNINELKTGHLTVGGTYLFCAFILPPVIRQFQELFPYVKFSLFEGETPLLERKLFSGELDLLIDNYPMKESIYEKQYFMKERLLLAVPASFAGNQEARAWRLTAEDVINGVHTKPEIQGVDLKIFAEEPFVMLRLHNDTRERVEEICKRAGIQPSVVLKLNQLLTVYHMTELGMGTSFVSDTVVKCMPPNPRIMYYKIDDPAAERNVYFYYRKNRYFTRSMAEFMKLAVPPCSA